MEKLELKLRNLDYFLMKLQGCTTEQKIELLNKNAEMKTLVENIKKGKEVNNVVENNQSNSGDSGNSTTDIGELEKETKGNRGSK